MTKFQCENNKTAPIHRSWIKQGVIGTVVAVGLGALSILPVHAQDKTIVWGKKLEATLLDPATSILASSWELLHVVYDGLTDTDENMEAIPGLAESWEVSADGTQYVFKLRQGIKFSNGRDVTPDDVIGSLQRMMDPKTGSFFRLQLGNVKSMSSSDSRTVTIELEEPYAPLLTALSSSMASIIPMKEVNDGSLDLQKDTLGTGPFMVESHAMGDEWVLVRNPHYYEPGLPKADKLIVRIMPSDQALIAGLRSGDVHVAQFDSSPDAKMLLQTLDNVEIVQNQQSNMYWLVVNGVKEDSPFTNQLVRQAVALSIDRKQIANMLGGGAQPSTAFAPMFNACDANQLDIFERDVKRAKALLKEAGVGKMTLDMPNVPGAVNDAMYAVLQKNFADIGITVNIENMDEGTWVSKVWVDNPMSVDLTGLWYAGYSDAIMVPLWLNPNKAGFTAGYQIDDAEMNAAVDGLRGLAGDDPNRPAALQNVCNMIHTQANHIPLVTRQETMAYRSDLIDASGIKHIDGYANNLADVETYTLH